MEEICTTKDLSDIVKEFKLVRLVSREERRLSRFFNDGTSCINKMGKPNNNVPASCIDPSSETAAEKKINAPDNPSRNNANFLNPLMSVNNVYNFAAHPWLKNTILIAGDSMINVINEKRISTNFESVKVRYFSGATTDDM